MFYLLKVEVSGASLWARQMDFDYVVADVLDLSPSGSSKRVHDPHCRIGIQIVRDDPRIGRRALHMGVRRGLKGRPGIQSRLGLEIFGAIGEHHLVHRQIANLDPARDQHVVPDVDVVADRQVGERRITGIGEYLIDRDLLGRPCGRHRCVTDIDYWKGVYSRVNCDDRL